jgi:hypothetical protein
MKQCNNSSLELCTPSRVDGSRAEGLPDDSLADIGGNEERDTGAETIAFLEKLVQ